MKHVTHKVADVSTATGSTGVGELVSPGLSELSSLKVRKYFPLCNLLLCLPVSFSRLCCRYFLYRVHARCPISILISKAAFSENDEAAEAMMIVIIFPDRHTVSKVKRKDHARAPWKRSRRYVLICSLQQLFLNFFVWSTFVSACSQFLIHHTLLDRRLHTSVLSVSSSRYIVSSTSSLLMPFAGACSCHLVGFHLPFCGDFPLNQLEKYKH
jgi:hypothetical protein